MRNSRQKKSRKRKWICQNTYGAKIKPTLKRKHESLYAKAFCRGKVNDIMESHS
jgi:hypothetical protein